MKEKGVCASNPGCFGTDFSFNIYRPSALGSDVDPEAGENPELVIYALDVDEIDRETANERVREDRPQRKRRRRVTAPGAVPGTVSAAPQSESSAIHQAAGQKTPKDRQTSRRRKDTPNASRSTVAPLSGGQRGINGYFTAALDAVKADPPPTLGRRRLTRATDSDEDEGGSSEDGQEAVGNVEDARGDEESHGEMVDDPSDDGSVASDAEEDSEPELAPARVSKSIAPARSRRVLQEDSDSE